MSRPIIAFVFVLLCLQLSGCGKPDAVEVSDGDACHLSEEGWKQCGESSVCLDASDLERMTPQKPLAEATVSTTSGTVNAEEWDCYGFMNDKCVRKGECHPKAKLDEPCSGTDMCLEGECLGNTEPDGSFLFRCRKQ